jgi:hypothetical protein
VIVVAKFSLSTIDAVVCGALQLATPASIA